MFVRAALPIIWMSDRGPFAELDGRGLKIDLWVSY